MNENFKATVQGGAPAKPPRKHRLLPAALIAIAGLLLLAALAPTILSLGVFRGTILAQAETALPARFAADGLSLSWLGSQEVHGLTVDTADGERVARADRVALDQGLASLLWDRRRIAAVRVEKAELWASGLAKLQEAIAKLPPKPQPPEAAARPEQPPTLPRSVHLADVTLHSKKGSLRLIEANLATDATTGALQDRLDASWQIESPEGRGAGTLRARLDGLRTDWRGWAELGVSGTFQCKDVSLATLCSLAAELGTDVQGGGLLTGDFGFRRDHSGAIALDGACDAAGLRLAAGALRGDRIALDAVHLEAKASYDRSELRIERLVLKSSVADAEAAGRLTLASAQGEPPTGNISGRIAVNLAPLAAMLRNTLNLQKDTTIDAGRLDATVQIRADEKTASLRLTADIKGLSGKRADKAVALSQVRVAVDADRQRPAPAAPGAPPLDAMAILRAVRVNSLELTAPFGSVRAAGRLEAFTLDANLDLTDTTEKVGQFVDLGGRTAQGTARAHLETQGNLDKGVHLAGNLDLSDVRLALGAGRVWHEPKAAVILDAAATFTPAHDLATLAVSNLNVDASTAKLAATGNLNRLPTAWGFSGDVSGSGPIARAADLANVVLAMAGGAKPKPAATDAWNWQQLLTDFIQRAGSAAAQPAEGQWTLRARAENADGKSFGVGFGAQVANLSVLLGPQGTAAPVQITTLAASGTAQHVEGGPWNISVTNLRLAAPDLSLAAAVEATVPVGPRAKPATLHSGSITAEGGVARTLGLADSVLAFVATAAPKRAAPAQGASGLESAQKLIHQLAGADAAPPAGRWKLAAKAASTAGRGLAANFEAQAGEIALLLDPKHAEPVRILSASLSGTAEQPEDGPWHFVVTDGRVATPEINLAARADFTLPADFNVDALAGTAAAQANVNLANFSQTLRATGLASDLPQMTGTAAVTVSAQTAADRRIEGSTKVAATDLAVVWPDGRRVSEPQVVIEAEAAAGRDAKGTLTDVTVTQWSARASAGQLAGTATLKPAGQAWAYHVAAGGGGSIESLAQVVAGILGGKASPIRGQWTVKGDLDQDAAGQRINVAAAATNLVIPPEAGTGASKELRLADIRVDASATVAPNGPVEVKQATITGPGLSAKAAGTLRLPTEKSDTVAADGAVSLRADLAELAKVLQPFGLLPPQSALAGVADLEGKVASSASGVDGAGTLAVTGLDVSLPEAGIAVKEPRVSAPVTVEYASGKRRWTISTTGLSSALVKGNASVSWTECRSNGRAATQGRPYAEPASPAVVQAECDLAFDGERLTGALGKNLPQGLRLTGPWGVRGGVSGPLPSAGPWNQRIAGLVGEGAVDLATFQYEKLIGGKGAVRWRLAGGEILIGDPAQPSQLMLAGGRMNLAARVNLKGPVARLIVPQPLRVVEGVPFSDPAVQDYLKFGIPLLVGGSVDPAGRVSVAINSLDLPLAGPELAKGVGTGSFTIDRFHTQLSGVLATFLATSGLQTETKVQTLGPVAVRLQDSVFYIQQHDLIMVDNSVMRFQGRIGLDRTLNTSVDVPLSDAMLRKFGATDRTAAYFANQRLLLGVTGTIDKPRLDEQAFWKRVGEIVLEAGKRRAVEELGNILKEGLRRK